MTDLVIDEALSCHGIDCNYVNGQWSGVSQARYRKIVRLLMQDPSLKTEYAAVNSRAANSLCAGYALPLVAAFLWEKAETKRCLLDYIFAMEAACGQQLLLPSYAELRIHDSPMQREWLNVQFAAGDLSSNRVRNAERTFISISGGSEVESNAVSSQVNFTPKPISPTSSSTGAALDILAASCAMERSFKPPIKLGRYTYGDGAARPDCVEVVVREIFETLIFGEWCLYLSDAVAH